MPPQLLPLLGRELEARLLHQPRDSTMNGTTSWAGMLAAQWLNPSDALSVLLLLGPDIVQRAVAEQAGRIITPVAFSFGWVAYATGALLSAFGDGQLMPDSDMTNTLVIGAMTGHQRTTTNWVLGRLLRDFDNRNDAEMENEEPHKPHKLGLDKDNKTQNAQVGVTKSSTVPWEALRVSVYEFDENPPCPHGVPKIDWVWLLGLGVILVQFVIAILAWVLDGSWATFMITASGSFLALAGGSLPQWTAEKWACPKKGGATVAITQGNGSRHVVVIKGKRGHGLDLEVLAQGTRTSKSSIPTRLAAMVLALLWIVLLITVAGMKQGTWYLLGIGLLGSIQNLLAAGIHRHPSALGVHLTPIETIRGSRVADVLKELEQKHSYVGTSLLPVFFPGGLRVKDEDIHFWQQAKEKRLLPNQYGTQV